MGHARRPSAAQLPGHIVGHKAPAGGRSGLAELAAKATEKRRVSSGQTGFDGQEEPPSKSKDFMMGALS